MSDLGEAFVRIRPDFSGFQSSTESGVAKALKRAAEVVGVAYGAKATFDFAKGAAEDAAGVQKSTELIKAQFGSAGDALLKFSENAGIHLGIAGHESEAVAARFGILFKNIGIGKQTASDMTLNMEKLGGAIAAIRGVDAAPILERLPIALAGNIRGLKQLGISIDAQLVKQTALALGYGHTTGSALKDKLTTDALAIAKARLTEVQAKFGSNTTQVVAAQDNLAKAQAKATAGVKETLGALTPAERATVIYTIATKHLADFQQQAAAHAGDYANVQRRLSAEWDHAREVIGVALLPMMTKYTTHLATWLDRMTKTGQLQRDVNKIVSTAIGIFQAIAAVVKVAYSVFTTLTDALGGTKNALILLFAAMAIGKVVALTTAITEGLIARGLAVLGPDAIAASGDYVKAFGAMDIATLGLKASLLALAGQLAVFVGAAALAFAAWKAFTTPLPKVVAPSPSSATTPGGVNIVEAGGKYYIQSAGGGRLTPYNGPVIVGANPQDTKGGSRGVGGGISLAPGVDFKDESIALRSSLGALAKQIGAIRLVSGFRDESKQTALWDASVKAGHPGFMDNGNPIAQPKSRGGAGSPHSQGIAADGSIFYNGRWVPLSSLPPSILARYGLTTVPGDTGHVQLASGAVVPTTDVKVPNIPTSGLSVGVPAPKPLTGAQISAARDSLARAYKGINDTAEKLGSFLTATIKKHMTSAREELHKVSTSSDIARARTHLDNLRKEVTDRLGLLRQTIQNQNAFAALKVQVAKLHGELPPEVASLMKKISGELAKAVTPQTVQQLHAQMTRVRAVMAAELTRLRTEVQQQRSTFDNVWGQLTAGIDNAFNKATSKALRDMQITVAGFGFKFGGGITQTPAEKALSALQASHQSVLDAKSLTDAQAKLADAQQALSDLTTPTTDGVEAAKAAFNLISARLKVEQDKLAAMQAAPLKNSASAIALQEALIANTQQGSDAAQQKLLALVSGPNADAISAAKQGVVDAQASLDDVLYNGKVNALAAQATLEQNAAAQQLSDAQNAYNDQRNLLQQQMDQRIGIIQTGMLDGSIAADIGMQQLVAVLGDPQYGLDMENSGLALGGSLYTGLSVALVPVFDLLDQLLAKMRLAGLLTDSSSTLSFGQQLSLINPPNPGPDAVERWLAQQAAIQKAMLTELKAQTDLADKETGTTVNVTGFNPNQIAIAAAR